jgi:hypothetical protein
MSAPTIPAARSSAGRTPAARARAARARRRRAPRNQLPAWPLAWYFLGLPVWWALGLIDVIVVPLGAIMALYLARAGRLRVPRGCFGVWLVFLFFMFASVIEVTKFTSYLLFGYRAAIYLACTALFLYVYNSWRSIPDRRVLLYVVGYFAGVVAGGYLGAALPRHRLKTPAYDVLSAKVPFLATNDLVQTMVIRPFSQYDPTNFFHIPPRPAAPFLYTNNWGNVYSLLLPLVLVFFFESRRGTVQRRVVGLLALASTVPATLTLNRGMFIGLALAAVYVGLRLAARGHVLPVLAGAVVAGGIGVFLWQALHVSAGLHSRVTASTDTRSRLYEQSLHQITSSPVFGFGVPTDTSVNAYDPKVGTQGQFWMVLVSHGIIAVACFIGFFLLTVMLTFHRRDLPGMVYNALLLIGAMETLFYGLVPYGLPLMMTIAALAHRPQPSRRRDPAIATPFESRDVQETSAAEG